MTTRKSLLATAFIGLGTFAVTTSAFSAADLVINRSDSIVQAGGCDQSSPLASGRIAIKNQGDDAAALGVTQRFSRSMLVVYVPENIDMIDKRTEREKLDPFDQEGVEFELGSGIVKKGRTFGRPSKSEVVQSYRKNRDTDGERGRRQMARIQRALGKVGFDPGSVDGYNGPNTRSAIRSYQRSIKALTTGVLTNQQAAKLFRQAGINYDDRDDVSFGNGARGKTTVTLYAVVDPYNLVEETDESNNIWAFDVEIDCN